LNEQKYDEAPVSKGKRTKKHNKFEELQMVFPTKSKQGGKGLAGE